MDAVELFANDYLIVIENDREGWDEITQEARRVNYSIAKLSDSIRDQWEALASEVIEKIEDEVSPLGVDLMRQMLFGWGEIAFDKIAREVIERDKETLGIKTENEVA